MDMGQAQAAREQQFPSLCCCTSQRDRDVVSRVGSLGQVGLQISQSPLSDGQTLLHLLWLGEDLWRKRM